ncbi:RNA methyltransferase [Lyngbya confervoides]|uniref:tRNA (cytidine/uridine-2'-O-)-methyltransferase TrmJ n=1 Tax=Lyngbya confervoides BDU141951 TaxID=1574623 RepID=A0ABD4SZ21_9CYAN|nr:RNA methyltransferase [Lyngbya confervoides]MCM1981518.1 RNA methyltransferase [Lyngbya confervoides BDU141951]
MLERLHNIHIVLVEPSGPRNVGSIARVMKNMGLAHLILINPQCDYVGDEARQMAVHAADILEQAQRFDTLAEGLAGRFRVIATTARSRHHNLEAEPPRVALPWLLDQPSALIFGREASGLTNQELEFAQRIVTLPVDASYASLNLAQAVGICSYELRQICLEAGPPAQDSPWSTGTASRVPFEALEDYFQHLEQVLCAIGYLYPHTAASRMQKFRQIYKRSQLTPQELAMLRGILRQTEWAIHRITPS